MAYQELERDMLMDKMIEEEKQSNKGEEKQRIVESIRRLSTSGEPGPVQSEEVRASFSLKDVDIDRIDKKINATMAELVKKTLHILVEVGAEYLQSVNKD